MKKLLLLLFILTLGFTLRTYRLSNRPLGFTWDEAALGYNAYSLLHTGKDEHAATLPIVFKSFGDYKPGLYIYFTVPAVAFFGLNEFATRLPSAIFGTLLILLVFLLTRHFNKKATNLEFFPALMLALSPLAVHFSRGAWEANIALALTVLAALLFIRYKYLSAAVFFGLTFLTYQGAKVFTPLVILLLIIAYFRQIIKKQLLVPLILLFIIALPILVGLSTQSGRLKVFSVFSYTRPQDRVDKIVSQDPPAYRSLYFSLFHTELIDQGRGIVQRYLNHFSPRYLFIEGDWSNPRQSTVYHGSLYLIEILTLLIGLVWLIRNFDRPLAKVILFWLIISPLPSAFSRDIISSVRSLPQVLPLSVLSGLGLWQLSRRPLIFLVFSGLLIYSVAGFLDLYLVHSPAFNSSAWLSPYRPAFTQVSAHESEYNHIVFTDILGQPYIFYLFYNRIDPRLAQQQLVFLDNPYGDVGTIPGFGKFEFRRIHWPADRNLTSTLFVGDQYELPEKDFNQSNLVNYGEIKSPDNLTLWRVVGLH